MKWNPDTRSLEQFPVQLAQESDHTFSLDEFEQVLPQWDEERWQPRQQVSERVATESLDNPWDIRNFAHYLDGYKTDGRRGWATCKCPEHNGESDNSLHIEKNTGKFKCHAGCSSLDIYRAAPELAKSRGYQVPERQTGHRFFDLGNSRFKLQQQLTKTIKRQSGWGFGRKGEVQVEPIPTKSLAVLDYEPGERLNVWAEAIKQGYKYIIDLSATGSGKSHDCAMACSELFGVLQLIYVSNQHRNPSTSTLKAWADLEARHSGLYQDEFGKLRRADKGRPHTIAPNCWRNNVFNYLRCKNVPGADTSELVCHRTCQDLELCVAGKLYGYLHSRSHTLKQPRLRSHPDSLPNLSKYNYSSVVLLWDEAGEIFKSHRSISVQAIDVQRAIADLAIKLPQAFDALRPLLTTLHSYLSGQQKQPNKYGWRDFQIRAALPSLQGIDVGEIASALAPDLDTLLNPTKEYGVDLADLKRQERKMFSGRDSKTTMQIEQNLALNWLADFLDVLNGVVVGHLRIQYGTLTITLSDRRLAEIAQAAAGNIFLDATVSPEDLALKLGCKESEILVVRQAVLDTNNLEIIQVATIGRLGSGSDRSEFCRARIEAIINQIQQATGKLAVVDFKRHTKLGDGKRHWWINSRGTNDLENYPALALIGVPC